MSDVRIEPRVHHGGYKIRLGPSSGRIEWQPPPWINPDGEWRSNPIATARDPYTQAHSHTAHAQARDADAATNDGTHTGQAQARDPDVRGRDADTHARDPDDRGRDGPDP